MNWLNPLFSASVSPVHTSTIFFVYHQLCSLVANNRNILWSTWVQRDLLIRVVATLRMKPGIYAGGKTTELCHKGAPVQLPLLPKLKGSHHIFHLQPRICALHSCQCCPEHCMVLPLLPPCVSSCQKGFFYVQEVDAVNCQVQAMCQDLCPGSEVLGKQIFGDFTSCSDT